MRLRLKSSTSIQASAIIFRAPEREIILHLPVVMDSGRLRIFDAFRVQHSIARGPCKGGVRFTTNVTLDEIRGLAAEMTLEMRRVGYPLWRCQGGSGL